MKLALKEKTIYEQRIKEVKEIASAKEKESQV